MFEGVNCRFTDDGRKIVEKLIQGLSTFPGIKQGLERYAGAPEDGSASEQSGSLVITLSGNASNHSSNLMRA